jgi:hypothetical protein
MCRPDDYPPYDEPLEDSVDWVSLRQIRDERRANWAVEERRLDERRFGIPIRENVDQRQMDRMAHSQARNGR